MFAVRVCARVSIFSAYARMQRQQTAMAGKKNPEPAKPVGATQKVRITKKDAIATTSKNVQV